MNLRTSAAALAAALLSAALSVRAAELPADLVVGREQNGKIVELQPGQALVVRLEGNPTTGFQWSVVLLPPYAGGVQIEGPTYTADPVDPRIVGSGGVFTSRVIGLRPGDHFLEWQYRRPWEEGVPPADVVRMMVRVTNDAPAAAPERLELWPPGTEGLNPDLTPEDVGGGRLKNIGVPWMDYWPPAAENRTGAAVILFPGGGYGIVSRDPEGARVARALSQRGIAAFVVNYRLPGTPGGAFRHPAPLDDAQQAIRQVRARAAEWGLRPDRIGVCGFSAGGHLAAMTGTRFARPVRAGGSSCRPDFMMLIYPVIHLHDAPHAQSRLGDILLGPDATAEQRIECSPDLNVPKDAPPAFLAHARNDPVVSFAHSTEMDRALRAAGVPSHLELYDTGGHGDGFLTNGPQAEAWFRNAMAWLEQWTTEQDARKSATE
ncbi:MAG: alpha/beta hydrolase fold domain-containing protein [Kiritimatiellae bacterium]|nr:alpha/beta hydrolase fold domain-containing protein [Kiritimatiellia bacterium]